MDGPLDFKPLTDGLGFHPFADGLPYAPVRKTQAPLPEAQPQQGTGAVSAGHARFATQLPRVPVARVSVPVASSLPLQESAIQARNPLPAAPEKSGVPAPGSQPMQSWAYLPKRLLAYSLDSAFNMGLCAVAFGGALWKQGIPPESLLSPGTVVLFTLFLLGFNWAILTAQEVAFGTSLFKRLFGLELDGSATAIFLRAFFFLPSLGFCGVGLLWAGLDRRRRCWHDLVVNLQPVETARL